MQESDISEQFFTTVGPVRSLSNAGSGPVEFQFEPSPVHLSDLSQCYLNLSVKMKRVDGSNLEHRTGVTPAQYTDRDSLTFTADNAGNDAKASCANNLFHTLFSEVELKLNGNRIERVVDYPYVAFLSTLLGFDDKHKENALGGLQGWYVDQQNKHDSADNTALNKRIQHMLLNGREAHFKGRLCLGTMDMGPQLIPNHMKIEVLLTRKDPNFVLIDHGTGAIKNTYTFELTNATLDLKRVGLYPEALQAYEEQLKTGVDFHFLKTDCKAFVQPPQTNDILLENMFAGQVPKSVLVAMTGNAAYHGQVEKNPFHFRHFDVNTASLLVNGTQFPGPDGYRLAMSNHKFVAPYLDIYRHTHVFHGLTKQEYAQGTFFLMFDLSGCDDESGVVAGRFFFDKALEEAVTLLALATTPVSFKIDNQRNIHMNYTP